MAIPCGLIAKSLFNDTYVLAKKNGIDQDTYTNIEMSDVDIAW